MNTMTTTTQEDADRFARFQQLGGKFRVAIINRCNLDCFFCHNEAMANPRRPRADHDPVAATPLGTDDLVAIINTYAAMGGRQINLTGGEPLAHPDLPGLLARLEPRGSRIMLNTNGILAHRLLRRPRIETLDGLLVSLHTTDDDRFKDALGGTGAQPVMDNIVALRRHGYAVSINYSLGAYNRESFGSVVDFARQHGISLKTITLVRSSEEPDFYGGDWIDPVWLEGVLTDRGAEKVSEKRAFGGFTSDWELGGTRIRVKNIGRGRLRTGFCDGCAHQKTCGEGIYGVRVGVDGLWKPCLLRRERFTAVDTRQDYAAQIHAVISAMIGEWREARYQEGAPA
jgi:molybdenum cofactor biosynthesis enzyme MoaA